MLYESIILSKVRKYLRRYKYNGTTTFEDRIPKVVVRVPSYEGSTVVRKYEVKYEGS